MNLPVKGKQKRFHEWTEGELEQEWETELESTGRDYWKRGAHFRVRWVKTWHNGISQESDMANMPAGKTSSNSGYIA